MLTTLSTLKSRLSLDQANPQYDALLTNAIKSLSAALTKKPTAPWPAPKASPRNSTDTEILASCYPIESVQNFETKTSEANGWQEISPAPDFLIRSSCIISLCPPFSLQPLAFSLSRVSYTGGYVLPGTDPTPGQTDSRMTAVEQITYWFQNRDHLGLKTYWPSGAAYYQFAALDLLPSVQVTLAQHRRWSV